MANLDKMTIPQLDVFALEKGVDLSGAKTKQDKIIAIREALDMNEVITVEALGVTLDIDTSVFVTFEFLEGLDEIDKGNVVRIASMFKLLCGDDYKRVKKELEEDGVLTAERASEFFVEVMSSVEAKNS